MRINIKIVLLVIVFLLLACENMFDYSPYAIDFSDENRNVNPRNVEKLHARENDDTISIAFTGDTHRFFDETELFVSAVNKNKAIDFLLQVERYGKTLGITE